MYFYSFFATVFFTSNRFASYIVADVDDEWSLQNLLLAASLPQGFPDTSGHFGLGSHMKPSIFGDPLVGDPNFKIFPNCIPSIIFAKTWSQLSEICSNSRNLLGFSLFFLHLYRFNNPNVVGSARSTVVDVPRSGKRTPCWRMCGVGGTHG